MRALTQGLPLDAGAYQQLLTAIALCIEADQNSRGMHLRCISLQSDESSEVMPQPREPVKNLQNKDQTETKTKKCD